MINDKSGQVFGLRFGVNATSFSRAKVDAELPLVEKCRIRSLVRDWDEMDTLFLVKLNSMFDVNSN